MTLNQKQDYDEYQKQLATRQDRNLRPIGLPDNLEKAVCEIQRGYRQYHSSPKILADNLLFALQKYINGDRQEEQFIFANYKDTVKNGNDIINNTWSEEENINNR